MQMPKPLSLLYRRLIVRLTPLLFLVGSLAGCATVGTAIAPDVSLACNTYGQAGTYSKTKDTAETVRGIQVKNRAFENIGCKI